MKKLIFIILLLCVLPKFALSAPDNIVISSGTISEGEAVTITLTGGGAGDSTPHTYDNFQSGTPDATLNTNPQVGVWTVGGSNDTVYSTYGGAYSGTQSAYTLPTTGATENNVVINNLENMDRIYFSYRFKYDNTTGGNVTKVVQLWGNGVPLGGDFGPGYFLSLIGASDWSSYSVANRVAGTDYETSGYRNYGWTLPKPVEGSWSHIEVVLERSTQNTSDGTIITKVNGGLKANDTAVKTRMDGYDWDKLKVFYAILADDFADMWIDDLYFNDAWNRVFVGDNSDITLCTGFDIWYVTSWSDTSIEVVVGQGAYTSGQTGYLFVADSNNIINTTGVGFQYATSTAPVVICQSNDTTTETSYAITATYTLEGARTVSTCTWSNSLGGSGSLTATGGNISGTITGLSVGDNVITITLTDSSAESGNCNTTITRTAATSYTAKAKKCTLKKATLK